jgi:hypothetical protein
MDKNELIKCIDFFKELKVFENDITTEDERSNHIRVVVVDYIYKGKIYRTSKLYYKSILHQGSVRHASRLLEYFEHDIYWLDISRHNWPHGKGAEIEKTVIADMYDDPNPAFENLLKSIANNHKNGFLQKVTGDGRSQQYGFNLENNNHWHDLIKLVQFVIFNKGQYPPKDFFERLIFEWHEGERTSLSPEFGSRSLIVNLLQNIKSVQNTIYEMEIINILKQKGQIILQGPPGTGKTYTAKDIAEQLIFSKITVDKKQQKALLESTSQFKLIQFHPAYSYEDFVRGIVAETKGESIEYKVVNKIFAKFIEKSLENYEDSQKDQKQLTEETWLSENFIGFTEFITDEIEKNSGKLFLDRTTTYLKQVDIDCFRYTGDNWSNSTGNRMYFKDILEMYRQNIKNRQQLRAMTGTSGLPKHHSSYFMKVLDLFYEYLKGRDKPSVEVMKIQEKPFVLIIDEINRANLPAVLGELIYALEYRGEKVEVMYPIEDNNYLMVPPNLFIIGTMNTSDRSVGHIDYAIRRRFAFIDILPKVLSIENFEFDLFKKVSSLFIKNFDAYVQDNAIKLEISDYLSEEFRPEDVWLGHSYFIKGEGDFSLRKKYEIIPILKEYVKDGILKQSALTFINAL